ncbi:inositol 2-dehydrogenase [Siminovitchia terrae]|uniref:Inositol 2-dehydrogenase n=1 Tax=Siminovitchia terrae TaxID=1914933 RepID=A0ABQ4L243_SIMTE|nr:inositol 2-dehydrogenase [Siminovitchia terrae]GIN91715.1 inositol 2-dehydrogenase [Siminovitchia terrae]GIN98357.1 inositol 2-dehydrogenase [Siminovitchia terrae]
MKQQTTVIGIIGAGRIGRLHAENNASFPNVRIKGISDLFADEIKEWALSIGIEKIVKDSEELLLDEEIEAIFVCSPTNTHAAIIKRAAKLGKHIFCEKPISFSIEETKEILEVVKKANVQFQVGFNRRFDRNFFKIQQMVKKGKIGSPHLLKITSRDPEPPPAEYVNKSGGLFFDMAIHDFDMARYLVNSEVVEVFATGANLIEPYIKEAGDIDTAITTLTFANGAIGVIDNSRKAVYGYDQRAEVFGEKGNLNCRNDQLTSVELSTSEGIRSDKLKNFFLERYKDAYIEEAKSFIECIQNGTPVLCNGYDGLKAEMIAEAAKQSYLQNRPVSIDQLNGNLLLL